jgi:hypothetical protein
MAFPRVRCSPKHTATAVRAGEQALAGLPADNSSLLFASDGRSKEGRSALAGRS